MKSIIITPAYTHLHWKLFSAILESQIAFSPEFNKSDLPKVRSKLLTYAVSTNAQRILCIDADIVPTAEQIVQLANDPRVTPTSAVSGLYTQRNLVHWAFQSTAPTPDSDGYMKGTAAGLGFCCIHRESLIRLSDTLPDVMDEQPWKPFCVPLLGSNSEGKTIYLPDDFSLWHRLAGVGVSLWGNTALVVGHSFDAVHWSPSL